MSGYDWLGVALVGVLGAVVVYGLHAVGGPRRFGRLLREQLHVRAEEIRDGWDAWRRINDVPADYLSEREKFGRAWADMLDALAGHRA